MPPVPQARSARVERLKRAGGPRRRRHDRTGRARAAAAADHARRVGEAYSLVMGEALARFILELADLEVRYRDDRPMREQARREAIARVGAVQARTFAAARAHLAG
jgi:hypothetical protein